MPEARRSDRARLAALIVEALDRIATPTARYEVIDRALMLAKRDSLPTQPGELLDFVDGPLHEAVLAILGGDAAELLHEHLGVLIARAGYQASAAESTGPNTLPPPTPTPASDVVPASSRRGSGAYVKPHATRRNRKTAGGDWRHSTLGYNASTLMGESNGKQRVVVVDDDPGYRRALVRLLDEVGYDVNAAPNVDTALWMCEKLKPDLVVTDYELGESNGVALAGEINRRMGDEAPPIILVTASAALPKHQSGIARVMVKSVNDDSIVGAAAELIRKRRA